MSTEQKIQQRAEVFVYDWMESPEFDADEAPVAACTREELTEAIADLIREVMTEGVDDAPELHRLTFGRKAVTRGE